MNIRLWAFIHKWTSLICTVFLLMLCLTGLPLIFHDEIDHLAGEVEAPELAVDTPSASLDSVVAAAYTQRPGEVIRVMSWDQEESPNLTFVSMASTMDAPPKARHNVVIDSRTGQVLDEPKQERGFMYVIFKLHVNMFAGLPGMFFLGFMGLLFVFSIISGIVLYSPFMRRLEFGTIRVARGSQFKWLDIHNLLGIATLIWALVVGLTGCINTLNKIIISAWQHDEMADMIRPYKNLPPKNIGSLQAAIDTAKQSMPDMQVSFVAFPGSVFSSPQHYTVFMKGNTPLTSRLLKPALIDAENAKFVDAREVPWYVKALLLSQPLHFGDYAGLPLKIIWVLFDLTTIAVLGSGLYLWWKKRKRVETSFTALNQ